KIATDVVQTFRSARHGRPEGLHYSDFFTGPEGLHYTNFSEAPKAVLGPSKLGPCDPISLQGRKPDGRHDGSRAARTASVLCRRRTEPAERRRRDASDPDLEPLVEERLFERVELDVRDGYEQQGQEQTERLTDDHRHGNRRAAAAADAEAERSGNEACD